MDMNEYAQSAQSSKLDHESPVLVNSPKATIAEAIDIPMTSYVAMKVNKKIRTIQQFMQFAAQIKTFKAYCEKFEFDNKTFNSNKQIVLNSIENLKSEFTKFLVRFNMVFVILNMFLKEKHEHLGNGLDLFTCLTR